MEQANSWRTPYLKSTPFHRPSNSTQLFRSMGSIDYQAFIKSILRLQLFLNPLLLLLKIYKSCYKSTFPETSTFLHPSSKHWPSSHRPTSNSYFTPYLQTLKTSIGPHYSFLNFYMKLYDSLNLRVGLLFDRILVSSVGPTVCDCAYITHIKT